MTIMVEPVEVSVEELINRDPREPLALIAFDPTQPSTARVQAAKLLLADMRRGAPTLPGETRAARLEALTVEIMKRKN